MSAATKVLRVWANPKHVAVLSMDDGGPFSQGTIPVYTRSMGRRDSFLLLPIEDGALRVGDMLFRERDGHLLCRRFDEPDHPWEGARPRELWRLLMDAVEGVAE